MDQLIKWKKLLLNAAKRSREKGPALSDAALPQKSVWELVEDFERWLLPRLELSNATGIGEFSHRPYNELLDELGAIIEGDKDYRSLIDKQIKNSYAAKFLDNDNNRDSSLWEVYKEELNELRQKRTDAAYLNQLLEGDVEKIFTNLAAYLYKEKIITNYPLPNGAQLFNAWGPNVYYEFDYETPVEQITPEINLIYKQQELEYILAHRDAEHRVGKQIIKTGLPPGVAQITVYVSRIGGGADSEFVKVLADVLKTVNLTLATAKLESIFEKRIFRTYGVKSSRLRGPRVLGRDRPDGCAMYSPCTGEVLISDLNLSNLFSVFIGPKHKSQYVKLAPAGVENTCVRSTTELAVAIVHELGHAYFSENLTPEQRHNFEAKYFADRFEILPGIQATSGCISSRSLDAFEEDFAETFAYLLGLDLINSTSLRGGASARAGLGNLETKTYIHNEQAVARFLTTLQESELTARDAKNISVNFSRMLKGYCAAITKNGRRCTMPVRKNRFCTGHRDPRNRGKATAIVFPIVDSVIGFMQNLIAKGPESISEISKMLEAKDTHPEIATLGKEALIEIFKKMAKDGEVHLSVLESLLLSKNFLLSENAIKVLDDIHSEKAKAILERYKTNTKYSKYYLVNRCLNSWDSKTTLWFPRDPDVDPEMAKINAMIKDIFGQLV